MQFFGLDPVVIYMFKVNNRNTRTRLEIGSFGALLNLNIFNTLF